MSLSVYSILSVDGCMQVGAGVVVGAVGGGVAESVSGGGVMEQGLSWLQHEPDPWHLALE